MTAAQCTESFHWSTDSARQLHADSEHDAHNETTTMSSHGPSDIPPIASSPHVRSTTIKHAQTQTSHTVAFEDPKLRSHSSRQSDVHRNTSRGVPVHRIQFVEFAEQLRQQQYFENRKRLLQQRKGVLQKTITLSARLHRISSWIGDGLVEISDQSNAIGFSRVHQHIQNLIELSYSQWDHELHILDPLGNPRLSRPETAGSSDVLSKLSSSAQADLFELLFCLRSNPRFLVERFKVLQPPQIVSLWNPPRFSRITDAAGSEFASFVHGPDRMTYQRVQSFSKSLEDYASSFERSNPLSFLLFNMYGTNQSSLDSENRLRLSTWSTICAELMLTKREAYSALVLQLLESFASLYEWRARDSVQLFLMDILQRGAFLLDHSYEGVGVRRSYPHDPLMTPQAQEFFDKAVYDLFAIFERYDGGFPTGALQFAAAVLHKLPQLEQQMEFRGMFFSDWFLDTFLRTTIMYPENENMLLKFHVSSNARTKILGHLWNTVNRRVRDVYRDFPSVPVDPEFRRAVETVVGTVDSIETTNPYLSKESITVRNEEHAEASITISTSEIVKLLESLSPQAMGAKSDHYHFEGGSVYDQYLQASNRFDDLKNDLILILEPGSSTIDAHPCQEQWLQIEIDRSGRPKMPQQIHHHTDSLQNFEDDDLDDAQRGALRLFRDQASDLLTLNKSDCENNVPKSPSLETLFREMEISTSARLDPIGAISWARAIDTLHEKYPLSTLIQNDTAVLRDMFGNSKRFQDKCKECCSKLEIQMSMMEDTCLKIRSKINKCVDRVESLRLKIWYSVDVVPSKHYIDAKNIARALNNMAIPRARNFRPASNSTHSSRPSSSTSSMFDIPYKDTINLMKAPAAQGGPKKLADKQIELTRSWLKESQTENFCKGEERIHRFCMEVYTVSKILVGETLTESPVLWASDLFARERSLYDIRSFSVASAPASSRAASVMSDTMSTSHRIRMALFEDRRPIPSNRISRDCLPPELASSIGSLSRAHSATTAESISSVYTPLTSNARSQTSASVYSRPTSVFNDPGLSRFTDTARAKSKFLEKVHQVLLCLLLSDLGCPVWSLGSETDAMLDAARNMHTVDVRLNQRVLAEALADETRHSRHEPMTAKHRQRSKSMSTASVSERKTISGMSEQDRKDDVHGHQEADYHFIDLSELLRKLSQQVDPVEKLAVAEEFHDLSLTTLKSKNLPDAISDGHQRNGHSNFRRGSLDARLSHSSTPQQDVNRSLANINRTKLRAPTTHEVVQHLKSDLAKLRPKTLFRDLQYISAFVSSEHTDNTSRGKALLQLGLAALSYKDEVCRSMVDVADKLLSQNTVIRSREQIMPKVAQFWMSAAREGNPVAQRELALLYLTRPELLEYISLPLAMPSEIFTTNMLWWRPSHGVNTPALYLALHWMRQASSNGDKVAKQKLQEREQRISIR